MDQDREPGNVPIKDGNVFARESWYLKWMARRWADYSASEDIDYLGKEKSLSRIISGNTGIKA